MDIKRISDQNSLLVPIHLEAWVMDRENTQELSWLRMNYDHLSTFEGPVPEPFNYIDPRENQLSPGIHLHWALPDALTHGKSASHKENIVFPYTPNRWLIARFGGDKNTVDWESKFWVVQSDHIKKNPDQVGDYNFLNPHIETKPNDVQNVTLGAQFDIKVWESKTDTETKVPFLQAVGPGNVSFSAYMPHCRNVYTFSDNELPKLGTHSYTYLVVGWYSDPSMDPLRGVHSFVPNVWKNQDEWSQQGKDERFLSLLTDLKWWVRKIPSTIPSNSLYHGAVYEVQWPSSLDSKTGGLSVDPEKDLKVVVGNTSSDALAALIQSEAPDATTGQNLAELFQAAQLDALLDLDQPDGSSLLNHKVQESWFESQSGGTIWTIVKETAPEDDPNSENSKLSEFQQKSLDQQLENLNKQQKSLDCKKRTLESYQAQLYHLWWKLGVANVEAGWGEDYDPGPLYPKEKTPQWDTLKPYLENTLYPDLKKSVLTNQREFQEMQLQLPNSADSEQAQSWAKNYFKIPNPVSEKMPLNLSDFKLKLKATLAPRFYRPNDPVILIANIKKSKKHGHDGRYNPKGKLICKNNKEFTCPEDALMCRNPMETITGLSIKDQPKINSSSLKSLSLNPLKSYQKIPELSHILLETFLIDPINAPLIAKTLKGDAAKIQSHMQSQDSWQGVEPVPFSVVKWEQPWSPLFLEWGVNFYPTGQGKSENRFYNPKDWTLDGEKFTWNGSGVDQNYKIGFVGRSVLASYASLIFKEKIKEYLSHHNAIDTETLENLLKTIEDWDIVGQSLGGFNQHFLTLSQGATFPPTKSNWDKGDEDIKALIGDQYHYFPNLNGGGDPRGGTIRSFYPIRAGFLEFTNLNVIDTFSQSVKMIQPNTSDGGFVPLLGQGLTLSKPLGIKNSKGWAQLPPRVVQDMRLKLEFDSIDTSDSPLQTSDETQIIRGWFLPNHLDKGMSVYDTQGELLGEIVPFEKKWQPRHGKHPGPRDPEVIKDPVLKKVVTSITNQSSDTFNKLLTILDEAIWMIEPQEDQKNQMLSTFIGRPLAVVQASISFELYGSPVFNQKWNKMLAPAEPPFQQVKDIGEIKKTPFNIRLGSLDLQKDGLLGYYLEEDFHTFYAPHILDRAGSYFQKVCSQNYIPVVPQGKKVKVTMIIDPRGSVHASSGVLPPIKETLSQKSVEQFMERLNITFNAGPVLVDSSTFRIPIPDENKGDWKWIQPYKSTYQETPLVTESDHAQFSDSSLVLKQGWMSFKYIPKDK